MNTLKFTDLSKTAQEKLKKRISDRDENLVVKKSGIAAPSVIFIISILWFALLVYLTNSFIWGTPRIIFYGLISLVAAYFLISSFVQIFRSLISPLKQYLLVTPAAVVDVRFNEIRYWTLEELLNVGSNHIYENRKYKKTKIELNFADDAEIFEVNNLEAADEATDKINHLRKLYIEASARNDLNYLNENNDFSEIEDANNPKNSLIATRTFEYVLNFSAALILTFLVIYGAIALNNYFDDKLSWESAQNIDSASSFRTYLQTHQQGRWKPEANAKLQDFYVLAEQNYRTALNDDHDENAVEAFLEVLKFAKETQNYRVKLDFNRQIEIPANIEEELKREFEVEKILPLGDTFSDENMNERESVLTAVISNAFRQIIPGDVLEFSKDCADQCVKFVINYKVNTNNSVYYDLRQKELPENERVYYPGISIDWDFGIQIPEQSKDYKFNLSSFPASEISYDTTTSDEATANKEFIDVLNIDKSIIYASMTKSAFDDFRANLVYRLGIGTKPIDPTENKTAENSDA